MVPTVLLFYGFSGSRRGARGRAGELPVCFPGEEPREKCEANDYDLSFERCATTLKQSLARSMPGANVLVTKSWSKTQILETLGQAADESVTQVHVFTHGDAEAMWLAYNFDRGRRLAARAKKFSAHPISPREAALAEDAWVAGLASAALSAPELQKLRRKFQRTGLGATWHVWGCYSGGQTASFGGLSDPVLDAYLKNFNGLAPAGAPLRGVARDLAHSFQVNCTAGIGNGLEFWHGPAATASHARRIVLPNTSTTKPTVPFWIWPARGSRWITFDANGNERARPILLGREREPATVIGPQPPSWLTDLYYMN
jgi:hypothetical protein